MQISLTKEIEQALLMSVAENRASRDFNLMIIKWRLLKITLHAPFLNDQMMSDHNSSDHNDKRCLLKIQKGSLIPYQQKTVYLLDEILCMYENKLQELVLDELSNFPMSNRLTERSINQYSKKVIEKLMHNRFEKSLKKDMKLLFSTTDLPVPKRRISSRMQLELAKGTSIGISVYLGEKLVKFGCQRNKTALQFLQPGEVASTCRISANLCSSNVG
ncbi:hypothetical protein Tco_0486934 [Tanacetum coccineum]